ncbi:hypothetical protein ABW19_dt0205685 [Dactylella cylindrospora]|nr:hypothetical protein ABW19_dt0205685 [Dactylella cylindrospora]
MASEAAARTRILSHMNKDHVYDTKLYLVHRLNYPKTILLPTAKPVVLLSDIQTTHISVSIDDEVKEIPFEPPMNSLADSRVRLVEMTRAAEAALRVDRDMVGVKVHWQPPERGEIVFLFAMLTAAYILFLPTTLLPGGFLRESILKDYPAVAELMYQYTTIGYWTFVLIHAAEAAWFSWAKLAKFWVVPGVDAVTAGLWFLDVAVNGLPTIKKWDRMVRRQTKKKGAKDH